VLCDYAAKFHLPLEKPKSLHLGVFSSLKEMDEAMWIADRNPKKTIRPAALAYNLR
jgi:hypothetical protein